MGIWLDKETRVICQGITGKAGAFHTKLCMEYGTQMVAGVSPGKAGQNVHDLPVFNSVGDAVKETQADATLIFVPAKFAQDAIQEAADGGIKLIICITEGIPVLQMLRTKQALQRRKVRLIGPNCPGIITPGKAKIGIMPGYIHKEGSIGLISRSGTLTYEVVYSLTQANLGQSTCIGIGGDPIIGSNFNDCLEAFAADPQTEAVVLIGEIGGEDEEEAAHYISKKFNKPVVAFIAGRSAPPGRRMGHAGAIITGSRGTAKGKIEALKSVGVEVAEFPWQIPDLVKKALGKERLIKK
jgi:succinyl-CoA synthetase alpha subunit